VRLVLLGPPGVGKGTQGRRLATARGWALVSTGEILREAAANGSALGLEARRVMDAGNLVSDDVMIGLVRERTEKPDASGGFVLDGFPRTLAQADALAGVLDQRGHRIDAVIHLTGDADALVQRMAARRECPVCKRAYNLVSAPPKDGRHCDDHPQTALVQRADDAEETIRLRLIVYRDQTEPLVSHYRKQGILRDVVGIGTMDEVFGRLNQALASPSRGA
jgi:adenylate kinase